MLHLNRKQRNALFFEKGNWLNLAIKNRKFTTMDFCPSILAALGVEIEGERIGLGTNLFSDKQTLPEEYGYETMFEELGKKSVFYNKEILYP